MKILDAVKCGNHAEAARILTELKKNRKKRTKRMKIMKVEEDEVLQNTLNNNSTDYNTQHKDYLYTMQQQQQQHQQQYPFHCVRFFAFVAFWSELKFVDYFTTEESVDDPDSYIIHNVWRKSNFRLIRNCVCYR